jgi:hypothetical protein
MYATMNCVLIGQQGLAQAAVLLGDHQAEQPELLEALDDLGRVLVLVLELGGNRDDLLVDELTDGLEDLFLDVSQALGLAQATHAGGCPSGDKSSTDKRHVPRRRGRLEDYPPVSPGMSVPTMT